MSFRKILLAIAALLLIGSWQQAKAEVVGTIPIPAGLVVYFTDTAPPDCAGLLHVEARSVSGEITARGCWGGHNETVIVLWNDGPAEVVHESVVKWLKKDDEPAASGPAKIRSKS